MKKVIIILMFTAAVCSAAFADEKEDMLKSRAEYFKKNYTEADKKTKRSVNFGGEVYNIKWAGLSEQGIGTVQFLREKDDIKKFKKMVTAVSCPKGTKIDEYITSYVAVVKPYIANQPVVLENKKSKFSKDMIVELVLVDKKSKVIEYSLFRAYETKGGEVNGVIYAQRFDYETNMKDNTKMAEFINQNVEKWMKDIFEIEFNIFG